MIATVVLEMVPAPPPPMELTPEIALIFIASLWVVSLLHDRGRE